MRISKIILGSSTAALLVSLALSWTAPVARGDDYYGEDPNKKIIKNGLLGAATGAIAASASGGKAGKGALIGAGVNVIGGAVLDSLTSQPKPQPQYAPQPQYQYQPQPVEYRAPYQAPAQAQTQYANEASTSKNSYSSEMNLDDEAKPKSKHPGAFGGCSRKE